MSSKAAVSLEGSGEIIEETGRLFETIVGLNQRRIALKLDNERKRQENARERIKDELAVTKELLQVLGDYLELKLGDDFRSSPEAKAAIGDVLAEALAISDGLVGEKKFALLWWVEGQGNEIA